MDQYEQLLKDLVNRACVWHGYVRMIEEADERGEESVKDYLEGQEEDVRIRLLNSIGTLKAYEREKKRPRNGQDLSRDSKEQ